MPPDDELRRAASEAKQVARSALLDAPSHTRAEDTKAFQRKLYWAAHCLTMAELTAVLAERERRIWASAQRVAYARTWDHAVRSRLHRARVVLQHYLSWLRL